MAAALGVTPTWLSRYLALGRLPETIVRAFASPDDLCERHARRLGPLVADDGTNARVMAAAAELVADKDSAKPKTAAQVIAALCKAAKAPAASPDPCMFKRSEADPAITMKRGRDSVTLRFPKSIEKAALEGAFDAFIRYAYA